MTTVDGCKRQPSYLTCHYINTDCLHYWLTTKLLCFIQLWSVVISHCHWYHLQSC